MSIIRVTIQLDEKSDFPSGPHLLVSENILQKLHLSTHYPITIQLGQKAMNCKIQTFRSDAPILRIRRDVGVQLAIPNGISMRLMYEPDCRRIILGPVFGVLISKLIKTEEGMFGSASSFCKEITLGAKEKGILAYIFTLNDVQQDTQTVLGWTLKNNNWVQMALPYPDTVYNRLALRKHENDFLAKDFFSHLKERDIPLFNEHFLNKWQVHKALSSLPQAHTYLPSTQVYHGFSTIKEALDRYHSIYIKPTNGSLGKGIYRVSKLGNHFTSQYSTMSGSIQKDYAKLSDLYQSIVPRISKIPYLVQQGLNLVKIDNNPLDFRSLVQKDHTGNWAVTSIVGRSGQDQSIVSNLARGGTIMSADRALSLAFPWNTAMRPSTAHLRKVSISLAQLLEKSIPGHFAELGIDLAVDTNGKVWLLEINAKPSKNDSQVLNEHKTRPSVIKLLDYVLYINGMTNASKSVPNKEIPLKKLNRKKR